MASTAESNTSRTPGSIASPMNSLMTPKRSPSRSLRSGTPTPAPSAPGWWSQGIAAGDEVQQGRRVSDVVRVSGPIWSSELANATSP